MADINVTKILAAAKQVLEAHRHTRNDQRITVENDTLLIYVTATVEDGVDITIERLRQPVRRSTENQLLGGVKALGIESIQVEHTKISHNIFPQEYKWKLSSGRF